VENIADVPIENEVTVEKKPDGIDIPNEPAIINVAKEIEAISIVESRNISNVAGQNPANSEKPCH
jgi:hypothetical protein